MKTVHSDRPYPWSFSAEKGGEEITAEGFARVTGGSRLGAKLLVFPTNRAMHRFFRDVLRRPKDVCESTRGICCPLARMFDDRMEVDPRYFCILGFIEGSINLEIVSHECMHAGFAYHRRQRRTMFDVRVDALPEEEIVHPSGRLTSMVWDWMELQGLANR